MVLPGDGRGATEGFVCQGKVAFCPNRGNRTLLKTQMLGSNKVRLKLWRVPLVTGQKLDGRKQAWKQRAQVAAQPGEKL